MTRLRPPNLSLSIVVVSWAFNFVALKEVYRQISPAAVSLSRFALMYAVLVGLCLWRGESLRMPTEHRVRIALSGFISMGVYMVFFLEGMQQTSAPEGAIILAVAPATTYLLACLFRQERFVTLALLGSLVAFGGVALVVFGGESARSAGSLSGNLMVLASAVLWALSIVIAQPVLKVVSPLRMLTLSMPAALVVLVPYGASALLDADFGAMTPYSWLMFCHVALLSGVLAFVLFYEGLRQVGPNVATLYQYMVPPCTALFAWWVLGTRMQPVQLVGLVVVLAGVSVASRARRVALLGGA